MNKFKKMKLVPLDYDCIHNVKPSNKLDEEISKIYKTTHNEELKARLYTTALKKYLFKTHKYKNLNKTLDKHITPQNKINKLSFNLNAGNNQEKESHIDDMNTDVIDFEPMVTSTPTKEQTSFPEESFDSTLKNDTVVIKPRAKKLLANKKIKKYFKRVSLGDSKSDPKDVTWIKY